MRNLSGKPLTFDVCLEDVIEDLKWKIEKREGISSQLQRLLYSGQQLEDGHTLESYQVGRESTLHLVLRMRGT